MVVRNSALLLCLACFLLPQSPVQAQRQIGGVKAPRPKVIIYKTRKNYNHLVPVILSSDKKTIVSYPAPSDLMNGRHYNTPQVLNNKYLLDRRGINRNVAFLKLSYRQYAQMKKVPAPDVLYALIIDKDPLVEFYDCGSVSAANTVEALNKLIDANRLKKQCKSIIR